MNARATRELCLREPSGEAELAETCAEFLAVDCDVGLPVAHVGRLRGHGGEL